MVSFWRRLQLLPPGSPLGVEHRLCRGLSCLGDSSLKILRWVGRFEPLCATQCQLIKSPCTSFVQLLDHAPGVAFKGCRLVLNSPTPTRSPCPGLSSILVKPIYDHPTNKKLLKQCLSGITQNLESLNNCIWHICPKDGFCGKDMENTAVYLAVGFFNKDHRCTISSVTAKVAGMRGWLLHHASITLPGRAQTRKRRPESVRKGMIAAAVEVEGVTFAPSAS